MFLHIAKHSNHMTSVWRGAVNYDDVELVNIIVRRQAIEFDIGQMAVMCCGEDNYGPDRK